MENRTLNHFVLEHAQKASLRVLFIVYFIVYVVFILLSTYTISYKTQVAIEANTDTLSQLISIGDVNRIKSIARTLVKNETCSSISIWQENPRYLIDSFPEIFEKQDSAFNFFSNPFDFKNGNILLTNRIFLYQNDSIIGQIVAKTSLPLSIYLVGFFILGVLYLFSYFFLKNEFNKMGNKISAPLLNFYQYLKKSENISTCDIAVDSYKEIDDIFSQHNLMINEINEKKELEKELQKNTAIAQTTQMLAHDVRKPFSMVKVLLNIIEYQNDPDAIKNTAKKFLPEIYQATNSVNGMIEDIMNVGSNTLKLSLEPTNAQSIIITSLNEIFHYNDRANISLQIKLEHLHQLNIDSLKVIRVFANIINNAIEAMKGQGTIWIRSKSVYQNDLEMVEFCLGNNNSFIEACHLETIFDTFYTKGKKGGTGLGLAIAKKMVTAHGGKIYCKSSKENGVEFFFTLPASNIKEKLDSSQLPNHSNVLRINNEVTKAIQIKSKKNSDNFYILAHQVKSELSKSTTKQLSVVALDDETIYRKLIEQMLPSSLELQKVIQIKTFGKSDLAIDHIMQHYCDLVFIDVDLNEEHRNGFDVTKILRKNGFKNKICIHSNRGTFEFKEQVVSSGADLMIPKPLSVEHFLNLLLSIAKESNSKYLEISKSPPS